MKKIILFLTSILFFESFDTSGQTPNTWSFVNYVGGANGAAAMAGCTGFTIGNNAYIIGGGGVNSGSDKFWKYNAVTQTWTPLAPVPGGARGGAIAFSIGGKGYYGFGSNGTVLNDFYEYDTLSGWALILLTSPYPPARASGIGFSIGKKGYVGLGANAGGVFLDDFWEWDQVNNVWQQRNNYPNGGRYIASAFSIGEKGYVGLGQDNGGLMNNDFYEWDTTITNWNPKPNYPGVIRYGASSFSIGTKGYIGTGTQGGGIVYYDFFEWDQVADAWTTTPTIAGLPVAEARFYATGFSVGGKGYVVGGGVSAGSAYNDLWMYTPLTPQAPSICMVTTDSLSINNIIYWDKTQYLHADSFIVYREVSTNIYSRVGATSIDSLSLFIDTDRSIGPANGDPNIGSYRYKLQLRDTFGVYSPLSPYHNNVWFNDQQTGTFTWNQYLIEGQGSTPVANFFLMRDSANIGDWRLIGAVAGTQISLNDPTYFAYQTIANWRVDASGFNCTPSLKLSDNNTLGTIVRSKSNITNNRTTKTSFPIINSLVIYPQPATNEITVDFGSTLSSTTVEVYNILGNLIFSGGIKAARNFNIKTDDWESGVYILIVSSEKGKVMRKLAKE